MERALTRQVAVVFSTLIAACASSHGAAVNGPGGADAADERVGSGGEIGSGGSSTTSTGGRGGGQKDGSANSVTGGSAGSGQSPDLDAGDGSPFDGGQYTGPIGSRGVWTDVTPAGIVLSTQEACGNYGTESVQADPARPGDYYTLFMCQGLYKSTDLGQTWHGPINTGTNGSTVQDCAGAVRLAPRPNGAQPTLYVSCIRGAGIGFWRSLNAGVDWTRYTVTPALPHDDFYQPAVDPYDSDHLLMAVHGYDMVVESKDGGATWAAIHLDSGMLHAGTGGINFIDTGRSATARTTWLWLASDAAVGVQGAGGTWRTTDAGQNWVKVETNDHPGGMSEIYQPDTTGIVYMAGVYSTNGSGVFRTTDYGVTWTHLGNNVPERLVFGMKTNLYAMNGAAVGPGGVFSPSLEVAAWPGTGSWSSPGTPSAMSQGPAAAAVTTTNGASVVVIAGYNAGLWRYVEP